MGARNVSVTNANPGGGTATLTNGFTVTAVNSAPTDIGLSNNTIAENAGANATVGTLSSTDPDAGNTFTYTLVSGTGSTGNAAFNINGSTLRATSSLDFEAQSSYSVRVRTTDQGGLFFEKAFTINVTNVNETPTDIGLSNNTIAENAGVNATVGTLSSTDPDAGNTFTYTLVAGTGSTGNGAFNINGSTLRATSSLDFEGQSSYSVRIRTTDQGGLFFEKVFTVNVTNVNETPTDISLSNNTVAENAGANATVGTLSSTDPDAGNTFTYTLVAGTGSTGNGAFNISGSTLRATSSLDFEGQSSYSVRIRTTDQGGLFFEKVFTISVTNVNEAPQGTDKTISVLEDAAHTFAASDFGFSDPSDTPANSLAFVKITTLPGAGTLKLSGIDVTAGQEIAAGSIGNLVYASAANANGTGYASFTFQVRDNGGTANGGVDLDQSPNTITVNVTPVNDAPAFVKGADQTVAEDAGIQVVPNWATFISAGPGNESSQVVTFQITGNTNASLFSVLPAVSTGGTLSYTPAADASGTATITLNAKDDGGVANGGIDVSPSQTFTITVDAVNDAPVAVDDDYATDEDNLLSVAAPGVLGNDTDIDGGPLSAILVSGPANGSLTLNADGSFDYTPNLDFNGTDSFTYRAFDGSANSNVATVEITVNAVNDAPTCVADSGATNEDSQLTDTVVCSDVDSVGLSYAVIDGVANGTLTFAANGSFTYTPAADFNGTDGFTFRASDGLLNSNTVAYSITVNPVNDAPDADDDAYSTDEDTSLIVAAPGVLDNDTDTENDALTAALVSGPTNGSLTLNADGSFTYTPDADFNGSDSFTYVANDGDLDSNVATVTLTINPVNDAPEADDDAYSTDEDTQSRRGRAWRPRQRQRHRERRADRRPGLRPDSGSLTLNADGRFTYTPDADFNGSDSFTYVANDGDLDSNVATLR